MQPIIRKRKLKQGSSCSLHNLLHVDYQNEPMRMNVTCKSWTFITKSLSIIPKIIHFDTVILKSIK